MSKRAVVRTSVAVDGQSMLQTITQLSDGSVGVNKTLPAAILGTLTTRGSSSAGSVTHTPEDTEHTIATGDKIDIYWDGGSRRMVVVGTVLGPNDGTYTISGGAGDDLPAAGTALTLMEPTVETFGLNGTNCKGFFCDSNARASTQVVLTDASDVELAAFEILYGDGAFTWYYDSTLGNPLDGLTTIAKVRISHGEYGNATRVVRVTALYN